LNFLIFNAMHEAGVSGAQSLCRHVAWLAVLNVSDGLHVRAQQVMRDLRQQNAQLMTTEFVLLEVADALSGPSLRGYTVIFVNGLRRLAILHIFPATSGLLADGWMLYSQRPDKEWGLTDCTSFVVMTQEHITQAFTSDHHFELVFYFRELYSPLVTKRRWRSPPFFAVPAGTSAVPRHGPFQTRGPSCSASFLPTTTQSGNRPWYR
jgi:uncharacterized protein